MNHKKRLIQLGLVNNDQQPGDRKNFQTKTSQDLSQDQDNRQQGFRLSNPLGQSLQQIDQKQVLGLLRQQQNAKLFQDDVEMFKQKLASGSSEQLQGKIDFYYMPYAPAKIQNGKKTVYKTTSKDFMKFQNNDESRLDSFWGELAQLITREQPQGLKKFVQKVKDTTLETVICNINQAQVSANKQKIFGQKQIKPSISPQVRSVSKQSEKIIPFKSANCSDLMSQNLSQFPDQSQNQFQTQQSLIQGKLEARTSQPKWKELTYEQKKKIWALRFETAKLKSIMRVDFPDIMSDHTKSFDQLTEQLDELRRNVSQAKSTISSQLNPSDNQINSSKFIRRSVPTKLSWNQNLLATSDQAFKKLAHPVLIESKSGDLEILNKKLFESTIATKISIDKLHQTNQNFLHHSTDYSQDYDRDPAIPTYFQKKSALIVRKSLHKLNKIKELGGTQQPSRRHIKLPLKNIKPVTASQPLSNQQRDRSV